VTSILPTVEHIVVVMFENRSLYNMLGSLYPSGAGPSVVPPSGSAAEFDGLSADLSNPASAAYFSGGSSQLVPVSSTALSSTVPDRRRPHAGPAVDVEHCAHRSAEYCRADGKPDLNAALDAAQRFAAQSR
jgi:hypothetical protein